MSSQVIGKTHRPNLEILGHYRRYFSLHGLESCQTQTDNIKTSDHAAQISLCNHQKRMPWLWAQWDWHSLPTLRRMEMYLEGVVPVYTIMLIGRWSSDAFLHYIWKQVEQLLQDVAKKMLTYRLFWTIPDIVPRVVSNEDPWQRNHCDNTKMRRNIGCNASQWVQLPAFSLFNWPIDDAEEAINGGGIIFPITEGVGRGENWINNSIPNPNPPCAYLMHIFSNFTDRGGVWLQSCFVDWTLTEERERAGDWQINFF
jgi:hypothetical protein